MPADDKKAAAEAASEKPVKKKPPIKVIGVVAGIMLLEGAGVYVLVGMTSPRAQTAEAGLHDDGASALDEPVEIELINEKFQQMPGGEVWQWDLQVVLKVKERAREKVETVMKAKSGEIKEGIAQIVRRARPQDMKEPDLRTLNRQLSAFLDKTLGLDPDGNSRIERIVIPVCRGFQIPD